MVNFTPSMLANATIFEKGHGELYIVNNLILKIIDDSHVLELIKQKAPGICPDFDIFSSNRFPLQESKVVKFIAMQYHPQTLQSVDPDKLFENQTPEEFFKKCINLLKQLKALNIVHGDIAPNNIVLTDEMEPKLIDFNGANFSHEHSVDYYSQIDYASALVTLGHFKVGNPCCIHTFTDDAESMVYSIASVFLELPWIEMILDECDEEVTTYSPDVVARIAQKKLKWFYEGKQDIYSNLCNLDELECAGSCLMDKCQYFHYVY